MHMVGSDWQIPILEKIYYLVLTLLIYFWKVFIYSLGISPISQILEVDSYSKQIKQYYLVSHFWPFLPLTTLILYSEYKWITITNANFTTISGYFFTNCMLSFTKLKFKRSFWGALMGLNLYWFKSYGLRSRLVQKRIECT